jgi:hypothetical protein
MTVTADLVCPWSDPRDLAALVCPKRADSAERTAGEQGDTVQDLMLRAIRQHLTYFMSSFT